MTRKEKLQLALATVFAATSVSVLGSWFYANAGRLPFFRKPNILVLSFCSLRKDRIGAYGYRQRPTTPNIDAFVSTGSIIFDRAFNTLPWVSISNAVYEKLSDQFLADTGYQGIGMYGFNGYLRIPPLKSTITLNDDIEDSEFEKDYKQEFDNLRIKILDRAPNPFFVVAHIKYMHYPLIDRFNPEAHWDRFLTAIEKARLDEYVKNPQRYPEKAPFLLLLTFNPDVVKNHPRVLAVLSKEERKKKKRVLGLINNEDLLDDWKRSPGYKDDLDLIAKIYDANVAYLDSFVKQAIDLFGNQELKENTVVVLTGDHGESHMEHDAFTHGTNVYDKSLEIPTVIHIPGQSKAINYAEPIYLQDLTDFIMDIMRGNARAYNAIGMIQKHKLQAVVLRNCSNSVRGLRFENKWKYFVDVPSGEVFLFDLEKDPDELINVASANPEVISRLDALYWTKYPLFSTQYPWACSPWPIATR